MALVKKEKLKMETIFSLQYENKYIKIGKLIFNILKRKTNINVSLVVSFF